MRIFHPLSPNLIPEFIFACTLISFSQSHHFGNSWTFAPEPSHSTTIRQAWELFVLNTLEWDILAVTPNDFLDIIMARLDARYKHKQCLIRKHAQIFISLCITGELDFSILFFLFDLLVCPLDGPFSLLGFFASFFEVLQLFEGSIGGSHWRVSLESLTGEYHLRLSTNKHIRVAEWFLYVPRTVVVRSWFIVESPFSELNPLLSFVAHLLHRISQLTDSNRFQSHPISGSTSLFIENFPNLSSALQSLQYNLLLPNAIRSYWFGRP